MCAFIRFDGVDIFNIEANLGLRVANSALVYVNLAVEAPNLACLSLTDLFDSHLIN